MAIRGVYTKEEEQFIAEWKQTLAQSFWLGEEVTEDEPYPVLHRVATRELIWAMANAIDDPNPLWRDENYARKTRWGTIIAPPFFPHAIAYGGGGAWRGKMPPSLGVRTRMNVGTTWEFFKPIRVGDSFRVKVSATTLEDKTRTDGKGPRQFLTTSNKRYINQRDELVCIVHRRQMAVIRPHPKEGQEPAGPPPISEYRYTREELEFADRLYEEQQNRGAEPRYWEDVDIGNELKPVVFGPITAWDIALSIQGAGHLETPIRQARKKAPSLIVVDPVTGVPHKTIERHMNDRVAQLVGDPMAIAIGVMMDFIMGHVLTSWMGDDSFITQFDSQNRAVVPLGDTVFGRGKVIKKYIENDEHWVDIAVWGETNRGYICTTGAATVNLPSRSSTV